MSLRVLELFAGVGGCAYALPPSAEVVAAVDQDERAANTYRANHGHPQFRKNLATVRAAWLAGHDADLWWMSPPCQPYTIRGPQRDLDDRRAASFIHLVGMVETIRPRWLVLENVPWFQGSRAHALLRETLDRCGYAVAEMLLCPTELGIPNVRRRFYLVAGPELAPSEVPATAMHIDLQSVLQDDPDPSLEVSSGLLARFRHALHVVDASDPDAVVACFTRAYGRSPVYAGSYLRQGGRIRHFAPEEIARLLGFPESFHFPDTIDTAHRWKLIGNSLSIHAVRHVLRRISALEPTA